MSKNMRWVIFTCSFQTAFDMSRQGKRMSRGSGGRLQRRAVLAVRRRESEGESRDRARGCPADGASAGLRVGGIQERLGDRSRGQGEPDEPDGSAGGVGTPGRVAVRLSGA